MANSGTRSVTPLQLVTLLLTFLGISVLLGVLGAGLLVPAAGSAAVVAKTIPSIIDDLPGDLHMVTPAQGSIMYDSAGNVLARFYDKQRIVVPSDQIADTMKKAIVAIEDRRFYEHHGVDATGIGRAIAKNLIGSATQGASTITQQFVRNSLQERGYLEGDVELISTATEQTPERKLREMKYAIALEKRMSKDEILTGYLNIAPFGPITYGIEAAAQRYFSKSASELDWNEAALLAGLVQSPVTYDPLRYPEAAQERRDTVLGVLFTEELIGREEYDQFIETPVADQLNPTVLREGCAGASDSASYFCTYAVQQFLADESFGENTAAREHLLKTGGLSIYTTLDPNKQSYADEAVNTAVPDDDPSGLDAALASVVPATGQIVAMAQNTSYGIEDAQTTNNYAANGHFQLGSTFKVFTLLQWFKEGHNAYELVGRNDINYPNGSFRCNGQPIQTDDYKVNDLFGSLKLGQMDSIRAVGISGNQAFVNMASRVDFCQIFQTAADLGITENGQTIPPYPANIIGAATVSPLQMAAGFAALGNNGKYCVPQAMTSVKDSAENVLKEFQPDCKEVIPAEVARKVTTVLNKATSQYYSIRIADGRGYAGKTGTSDDSANTWMTGYTPDLSASVWVGHAKASSTPNLGVTVNGKYHKELYGDSLAGPDIWAPYMSKSLAGTQGTPLPNVYIGTPVPQPKEKSEDSDESSSSDDDGDAE
ncbi:transglycosylase domain-containing protein [Schaalia sp. lx-100]|uniref:transglycosylase domain-containing protein n=1 Tax=Schaalia sp. lx-100 TaxID=2899081 RepID=UPI001E631C69|nr:transglycosylase domain-containing protein [Schaalia sp. lx-100]MCD4557442.1 penicillin-binding protein [Schaalia sp. lx-100]